MSEAFVIFVALLCLGALLVARWRKPAEPTNSESHPYRAKGGATLEAQRDRPEVAERDESCVAAHVSERGVYNGDEFGAYNEEEKALVRRIASIRNRPGHPELPEGLVWSQAGLPIFLEDVHEIRQLRAKRRDEAWRATRATVEKAP